MARAKKDVTGDRTTTEIKKLIGSDKLIIGTTKTVKELKLGRLKKVYLTLNCPDKVKKNIEHYGKLVETDIEVINIPNSELGVLVKKPFSISVMSVLKE